MTIFHTARKTDGVPAPSDIELQAMDAANARRKFIPFVAVNKHDILLTIIGKSRFGCYKDQFGYLHLPGEIDRDLDAYAERVRAAFQDWDDAQQAKEDVQQAADARDQDDTHDDCQW